MAIEAEGHRELLDACRAGDPDRAEQAMRRHLDVFRSAFDTLLSELIRRDEWPPPDADCRLRAASADAAAASGSA
jgi:DNA-binding FadR family transcriptional regulator